MSTSEGKKRKREHGWAIFGMIVGILLSPFTTNPLAECGELEFRLVGCAIFGAVIGASLGIARDGPTAPLRPQFTVRQLLAFVYIVANLLFWCRFFWETW